MKVRRETILMIGLILALILITGAAALSQARQGRAPSLSSNSNAADGALALQKFLSAAGYQVDNQPGSQFAVPYGTDAVFILEPGRDSAITADEWKALDSWVRQGGTLLLAAQNWSSAFSGNPFRLTSTNITPKEYEIFPLAPIFRTPALIQPAHLVIDQVLNHPDAESVALLSISQGPVAWQIILGEGQLLVVADASFLTNTGLKNPGNAQLALNLISQIPQGSQVFLDEWHHGERVSSLSGVGLEAWLTQTPAGLAVLFIAGLIFLGLILSGRPFGQRVALSKVGSRRGSIEYVSALANLNRRAGHRQAVMKYYSTELKRTFGQRYRIDPDQPDADFIRQVNLVNPELDSAALTKLLELLKQKRYSENEMVKLAGECAGWMAKIEH